MTEQCAQAPEGVRADLAIDIATVRDSFRPGDRWLWFVHSLGTALFRTDDADIHVLAALSKKDGCWYAIDVDETDRLIGATYLVDWRDLKSMVPSNSPEDRTKTRLSVDRAVAAIIERVEGLCGLDEGGDSTLLNLVYQMVGGARMPGDYLFMLHPISQQLRCYNFQAPDEAGLADWLEHGGHLLHLEILSDVRFARWCDGGKFEGWH